MATQIIHKMIHNTEAIALSPSINNVSNAPQHQQQLSYTTTPPNPILCAMLASMGLFQVGFHTSFSSPTRSLFEAMNVMTNSQLDLAFSMLNIGAIIGAISSSSLANVYGRKFTLTFPCMFVVIGVFVCTLGPLNFWSLMLSRIIIGVAVGMYLACVPMYIAEISPTNMRGSIAGGVCIGFSYLGHFLCNFLGVFIIYNELWWTWILYTSLIVGVIGTLLIQVLAPETPRWIQLQNHSATPVNLLNPNPAHDILRNVSNNMSRRINVKYQLLIMIGCGLQTLQQFAGVNTLNYYFVSIFRETTESYAGALLGVSVVYILLTLLSFGFAGKLSQWHRRPVLLYSDLSVCCCCFCIVFFGDIIDNFVYGLYIKVLLYSLYMISAMGLTVLPFLVCAEILPLSIRSLGMGIVSVSFWGWNFILTALFGNLVIWFGGSNQVFLLFAISTLAGSLFIYTCIPETLGMTLENIEVSLTGFSHNVNSGTSKQ